MTKYEVYILVFVRGISGPLPRTVGKLYTTENCIADFEEFIDQ